MSNDWERTSLGEIARIKQGTTVAVTKLSGGNHPVYGANGVVGWHSEANVHEPTVSLGCRGSCGTVFLAPSGAFLANNAMGVSPADYRSMVEFLALLLENADLRGNGVISGQVQEQITRKSLSALPIQLPPIGQQRRIVDLVGSIDSCIDRLQTQAEATRAARSALLSELLSRSSDDWQETTLGELANWFSGGTPKSTNETFYRDGTIRWAVIADLLNDPVVETARQISEAGLAAIGGRLAPAGSVLVSMYGTIARTAVAGVPLATNQAIAWAEPHADVCHSAFLRLLIDHLRPEFERASRGAAQRNINRGIIRHAGVTLPPLGGQRRILDLIDAFDEQVECLQSQLDAARHVRSGVLFELLHGERLLDESYDVAVSL